MHYELGGKWAVIGSSIMPLSAFTVGLFTKMNMKNILKFLFAVSLPFLSCCLSSASELPTPAIVGFRVAVGEITATQEDLGRILGNENLSGDAGEVCGHIDESAANIGSAIMRLSEFGPLSVTTIGVCEGRRLLTSPGGLARVEFQAELFLEKGMFVCQIRHNFQTSDANLPPVSLDPKTGVRLESPVIANAVLPVQITLWDSQRNDASAQLLVRSKGGKYIVMAIIPQYR